MDRRIVGAIAVSLSCCGAMAQSFQEGDLYLVSAALPNGPGVSQPGVMRVQPGGGAWATTVISTNTVATVGRATYDSFRDRLVMKTPPAGGPLVMMDAGGATSTLAYTGVQDAMMPASAGDGRLYFIHSASKAIGYVDAQGATHSVMENGSPALMTNNNTYVTHFDVATNSLLLGQFVSGGARDRVEKISFNATGDQVVSRTTVSWFVPGASFETIVGLSVGPNGLVMVKLDDNSSTAAARLYTLDPVAMTVAPYASSGYSGAAAEVAGCYNAAVDAAVVLDTANDVLRVYGQGSSGAGSIVAGGVSSSLGTGETAQLVSIVKVCIADVNHDGFVTGDDFDAFSAWFDAGDESADFDHNGFVNGDDFDSFAQRFEAGC